LSPAPVQNGASPKIVQNTKTLVYIVGALAEYASVSYFGEKGSMNKHSLAWKTLATQFMTLQLTRRNSSVGAWLPTGNGLSLPESSSPGRVLRWPDPPSIYAVDDVPRLTELYTSLLEATGYTITTFNDRSKALAYLGGEKKKPSLLITDYIGLSMPIDDFMQGCRAVHPALRFLMASGFSQRDMRPLRVKPNRFIQKPFTPEELRREVMAALNDQ
jgi:CheY-like chemotaxis protein